MGFRWLVLPLTLALIGCSTAIKTRTETVEVSKPILYCPAVDLGELGRPETLPIQDIHPDMPAGEIAIRYKASLRVLLDYIQRLELTLDEYGKFNKSYEDLQRELETENPAGNNE